MFVDPLSYPSTESNDSELTDEQLINAFLDGIIHGNRPLQANKNLRVEPVLNSLQLFSNREGMLATVNLKQAPTRIELRIGTQYFQLLHDTLFDLQYLPCQKSRTGGESYQYRFCQMIEGYKLYCTIAKDLWRASWGRGFGARVGIPLDLIVWRPEDGQSREPWQSLLGMDCDHGQLYIKMLGRSVQVESSDLVVWGKKEMTHHRHDPRDPGRRPYAGRRF
ncbi:MAG: hypothetical protein AAGB01_02400 [Cyanobacteria bacterium P01_F01_bin.42]